MQCRVSALLIAKNAYKEVLIGPANLAKLPLLLNSEKLQVSIELENNSPVEAHSSMGVF